MKTKSIAARAKWTGLIGEQWPLPEAPLFAWRRLEDESRKSVNTDVRAGQSVPVSRLGIVRPLFKSLSNTTVIEGPQSIIAKFAGRVRRWKSLHMALRWHATARLDADTRMRRVRGSKDMPCLIAALRPLQAQARKAG